MLNAHPDLTSSVLIGLGWYYLIMCAMNLLWTFRSYREDGHFKNGVPVATVWAVATALLVMVSGAHFSSAGSPETFLIRLPMWFRASVNTYFSNPVIYFVLSVVLFAAMIWLREWWTRPAVAWTLLNSALLFMGLSMSDWDFRQIVGKPDNVPIVAMLFIVGFFTWIYFRRAVDNDRRMEEGRPLFEQEDNEKVLVWPDLVYTELICMVVLTAVLIFWGMALQAPLEEPGSSVKTPNPSKAPWYFLGLQEMLVYFDPWLAGVVLPSIILGGLMALPYIDFNRVGNGYYSFKQRSFAVTTFMFGFMPLWVALIVLGTFLRGPNWNFFGIYEFWDVHKAVAANNRNLSEVFWGLSMTPSMPRGSGALDILLRESPGIVLVIGYFAFLPPILGLTLLRKYFVRMGVVRFLVFTNLILWMTILPVKMLLRWTFSLKYIVGIPEYFFNI
jgi:Cytochrome b(C-terminal)/b6/petD